MIQFAFLSGTGTFGNEAYILTGYINILKILELTLFNGYDNVTNIQLGTETRYGYEFSPSVLAGEMGIDQMENLVRIYFDLDGHNIQFNVIDNQTLVDAQKHPDEYKNLIVRVAGYSDYFRNLSKTLQDEIIERTEYQAF